MGCFFVVTTMLPINFLQWCRSYVPRWKIFCQRARNRQCSLQDQHVFNMAFHYRECNINSTWCSLYKGALSFNAQGVERLRIYNACVLNILLACSEACASFNESVFNQLSQPFNLCALRSRVFPGYDGIWVRTRIASLETVTLWFGTPLKRCLNWWKCCIN